MVRAGGRSLCGDDVSQQMSFVRRRSHSFVHVSGCLSPFCEGVVVAATPTEGRCDTCGLRHRRKAESAGWAHLVGPLLVTVSETTSGTTSHFVVEADAVRFREGFFTIDVAGGSIRVEPIGRLVHLAADA